MSCSSISYLCTEGGVTGGFDVGTAFDEERWEEAQPLAWKKERALLSALQFGEFEEAEALLRDEGVSPNACYEPGHVTALHMAALNNNVEGGKLLLRYGADTTIKTESGATPLELARDAGASEFMELLEGPGPR